MGHKIQKLNEGERILEYDIYCDESCHLENDNNNVMLLSALWCPKSDVKRICNEIKNLQEKYNKKSELKWTKVSPADVEFYIHLLRYFYNESKLLFRTIVINNKNNLDHATFNNGSHDEFYYKMYYLLLNKIIDPPNQYKIYIDKKDTRSSSKSTHLKNILRNKIYDFDGEYVKDIRVVDSHQVRILQLADILMGAVSYANRNLEGNAAKKEIANFLKNQTSSDLKTTLPFMHEKFNIFSFSPRGSKK